MSLWCVVVAHVCWNIDTSTTPIAATATSPSRTPTSAVTTTETTPNPPHAALRHSTSVPAASSAWAALPGRAVSPLLGQCHPLEVTLATPLQVQRWPLCRWGEWAGCCSCCTSTHHLPDGDLLCCAGMVGRVTVVSHRDVTALLPCMRPWLAGYVDANAPLSFFFFFFFCFTVSRHSLVAHTTIS